MSVGGRPGCRERSRALRVPARGASFRIALRCAVAMVPRAFMLYPTSDWMRLNVCSHFSFPKSFEIIWPPWTIRNLGVPVFFGI